MHCALVVGEPGLPSGHAAVMQFSQRTGANQVLHRTRGTTHTHYCCTAHAVIVCAARTGAISWASKRKRTSEIVHCMDATYD